MTIYMTTDSRIETLRRQAATGDAVAAEALSAELWRAGLAVAYGPVYREQRVYVMRIEGGEGGEDEVMAPDARYALWMAKEWAAEGDWSDCWDRKEPESIVVDVDVYARDDADDAAEGDADDAAEGDVVIDPPEPECYHEDGHRWAEEGVQGHGGGVVIEKVCPRCGAEQYTDTWGQRRDTGEQGYRIVHYTPAGSRRERIVSGDLTDEEHDAWSEAGECDAQDAPDGATRPEVEDVDVTGLAGTCERWDDLTESDQGDMRRQAAEAYLAGWDEARS